MKWASAISQLGGRRKSLKAVFHHCAEQIVEQLGSSPDLCLCFVSPQFLTNYEDIPGHRAEMLGPAGTFLGCSAGGLIGGGLELEREAAVAMTAALLPGVGIDTFYIEDGSLPDLDAPQSSWEKLVNIGLEKEPTFILLPDPFSFRIDILTQGLDFAFPKSVKIGGLASGAQHPGMNALFLNESVFRKGLVGVGLFGDVAVDTIVAQGCKPVGWPCRVTKSERNILYELDGEPALHTLYEVLEDLSDHDKGLAKNSLFLGVVMNEFKDQFSGGDFLIRNVLGLEPVSGALLVGEVLRPGQTIQFHVRDADTSACDLKDMLERYRKNSGTSVAGALLFSCLGRGEHLYGVANHDSDCFRETVGEVPLGGFFCNGEIGPVGGTTFLHGYTSSFGIFRTK